MQQNQLADMIGVSPQHICHIEGGSTLSLPVLVGIAKALDVEPDVLLGSNVGAGRKRVLEKELGEITRDASPEKMELLIKIARAIME